MKVTPTDKLATKMLFDVGGTQIFVQPNDAGQDEPTVFEIDEELDGARQWLEGLAEDGLVILGTGKSLKDFTKDELIAKAEELELGWEGKDLRATNAVMVERIQVALDEAEEAEKDPSGESPSEEKTDDSAEA